MKSDSIFVAQTRNTTETSIGGLEVQTCLRAGDDFLVFIFVAVPEHVICLCTHCVWHPEAVRLCPWPENHVPFFRVFILIDTCTFTGLVTFQLMFFSSAGHNSMGTRAGLVFAHDCMPSVSIVPVHYNCLMDKRMNE